ncbi:hypothetical protein D3C75_1199190 [compost metagenome]
MPEIAIVIQQVAANRQGLLIAGRPRQPLLDLYCVLPPALFQPLAQHCRGNLQTDRQQLRTVALQRLWQMSAGSVDHHVDPLQ